MGSRLRGNDPSEPAPFIWFPLLNLARQAQDALFFTGVRCHVSIPLPFAGRINQGGKRETLESGRMSKQRNKWIGQSVQRLEAPPLVIGRGRFAGDINFPHQLHMRVVRSNHAHGRIVAIDAGAARALPGVFAVWTAADIPDVPPVGFREGRVEKLEPYRQPVLATERVRYVGDPVAAGLPEDPYVAAAASDLVSIGCG